MQVVLLWLKLKESLNMDCIFKPLLALTFKVYELSGTLYLILLDSLRIRKMSNLVVSLPYGEGAKGQGDQSMQLEFTGYYTIKRYLQRERERKRRRQREEERQQTL